MSLDSLHMQARLDAREKLFSRDSLSHVLLKTQGRSSCSHLFHKQQGERSIYSIVSVNHSTVLQCYTTLPFSAQQAALTRPLKLAYSIYLNRAYRFLEAEWQHLGIFSTLTATQEPTKHLCSHASCFSASASLTINLPVWSWSQAVNLGRHR